MQTDKVETALVTGGGSGMGRAVVEELCSAGLRVFVADVNLKSAVETAKAAATNNGSAEAYEVDISSSYSVASLFKKIKDATERLDLLVHTAAVMGRTAFIEDMEDEDWKKVVSVDLDGVFYCCREAVRWMKGHKTGRIILFSSVASQAPTPGALAYSAAKGGVNMLGKTLAQELAKYNIRVNIIAPGYIQTPMLKGLPEGFSDYVIKRTPLKRFGEVGEIARLVSYLASPEADFFTGQIFSPNGGFVI